MVRDRDIWFSVRDEIETFRRFHETETFGNYISRPRRRDRDYPWSVHRGSALAYQIWHASVKGGRYRSPPNVKICTELWFLAIGSRPNKHIQMKFSVSAYTPCVYCLMRTVAWISKAALITRAPKMFKDWSKLQHFSSFSPIRRDTINRCRQKLTDKHRRLAHWRMRNLAPTGSRFDVTWPLLFRTYRHARKYRPTCQ